METSDAGDHQSSQPGSPVKVQEQDHVQQELQEDEEEGYDTEEEQEVIENNVAQIQADDVQPPAVPEFLPPAEDKQCWICLACEQDDLSASWTHPCKCRGTSKWVHQACIQRWVSEKQKGNLYQNVECPQCATAYIIRFPKPFFIVRILDSGDLLIQRICPIVTGGVCALSVCWTIVTFGAVTLMQTVGHAKSLDIMDEADPLLLLVSLSLIPVGLVVVQMIPWEETVLGFLRVAVPKLPLVRNMLPVFAYQPERIGATQSNLPPTTDPISLTRIFCGALFFPTISTFLGATLFKTAAGSQWKRTMLGGLTFLAVKGVLKIYHKQHSYIRQCQKQILDYTE